MGFMSMFHASGSTELVPVIPHVSVYEEYVRQIPTTLELKEKAWSLSGDDFAIKDVNARKAVLKCKGKYVSMHHRKKITDATTGNVLYDMSDKMFSIHKTTVCTGPHNREVLRVKKKWSPGSKLTATWVDSSDKEHDLVLHGDMMGATANITLSNGTQLAHISRKLITATDVVADKQTVSKLEYPLSCFEGVR